MRDTVTDTWQLRLDGIPGNRTHRYMLLVDGVSAHDKNCDGLAIPEDFEDDGIKNCNYCCVDHEFVICARWLP